MVVNSETSHLEVLSPGRHALCWPGGIGIKLWRENVQPHKLSSDLYPLILEMPYLYATLFNYMGWMFEPTEVCYMICCSLAVISVGTISREMLGLPVLRSSDCTHGTEGVEASTFRFSTLIDWVHEVLFCGWMCHLKGSSGQDSSGCRRETARAGPSSPSFLRYEPYVNLIPNLQWIHVS